MQTQVKSKVGMCFEFSEENTLQESKTWSPILTAVWITILWVLQQILNLGCGGIISIYLSAPCHIQTWFPHKSVANRLWVFLFVCFLACFNGGTGSYSLFPFIFEVTCVVQLCVVLCYVVWRQVVGMRCDREVARWSRQSHSYPGQLFFPSPLCL